MNRLMHCPADCTCRGMRSTRVLDPNSPSYNEALARALGLIMAFVGEQELVASKQRHPSTPSRVRLIGGWLEAPDADDA